MNDAQIVMLPDSVLRTLSKEVKFPLSQENMKTFDDMIAYIDASQKPGFKGRAGVGIAAVQLGVPIRAFYVNMHNQANGAAFRDLIINPVVTSVSDNRTYLKDGEGCLSVGEDFAKPISAGANIRNRRIIVEGYSYLEKKQRTYDVSDLLAIIFQHEIDHLNGILYIDRLSKKIDRNASPINPSSALDVHLSNGYQLNLDGKYEAAIKMFDKAIEADPTSVEAYFNRGHSLFLLERFAEAINMFDKAMIIDPKFAQAYIEKADCLVSLKKYKEAISFYDKAITLEPRNADAYSGKGDAFHHLDKIEEAIRMFDKALALEPDNEYASTYKDILLSQPQK